jgi:hypothetical protein
LKPNPSANTAAPFTPREERMSSNPNGSNAQEEPKPRTYEDLEGRTWDDLAGLTFEQVADPNVPLPPKKSQPTPSPSQE